MGAKTMREFRDEVVSKAVLNSSAGGTLPPGAFKEFMQRVETGQVLLQNITIDKITRPQQEIHHLTAASRQLRAVTPGTAATAGTITPVERVFTPTRAVLAFDVSWDWIDDNADERDADAVMRDYIADLVGAELVDALGNMDGATADDWKDINAGFWALAAADSDTDVHDYNVTNTTMLGATGILANVRNALPTQYRQDCVIIMSTSEADQFIDELGARATALGDAALANGGPYPWQGFKIIGAPKWPNDKIIAGPRWNLRLGMWKDIRVIAENVPRKSIVEYTVELRFDPQYANGDALVYATTD